MNLTYSPDLIQAATISTAFIFFGKSEHIYIFSKIKVKMFSSGQKTSLKVPHFVKN